MGRGAKVKTYRGQASGTVTRARGLRKNATEAEKLMWRALRENFPSAKFRRQVPIGPYYADFFSFSMKLVIEVDGGQHGEAQDYDARRTTFIEAQGYRVIRFWNNDVLGNTEGVMEAISLSLREREGAAKRRKGEGN
jgi:very-short-patch-repair endonuclease